jgi:hypothetical protein
MEAPNDDDRWQLDTFLGRSAAEQAAHQPSPFIEGE